MSSSSTPRACRTAFAPALPAVSRSPTFGSAFLCSRPVCPVRPSRPLRFAASLPSPNLPSHIPSNSAHPRRWDGVRRVVHISAMSVALFAAGILAPPCNAARLVRPATAVTATATTVKDTSATGDAEAAAMTLGAVTIGGLVMRAIVSSRRDDEAEKKRLEAECNRLEQEEKERALRVKRKKMEMVEGGSVVRDDDELLSDFMKRVQSLENAEEDDDDNDDAAMRHTPIPDRGTGSAVLDRPDDDETEPAEPQAVEPQQEELAKPEELEMLNRMWNLNSGDADAQNKPTSSS